MTPLDYEYLRKLLKERSGLDLSSDKQYLVESRLLPLARKCGLSGIPDLVAKARTLKVGAGTEKGVTALQMDIKITSITPEIMRIALEQAKGGRLHILGEMAKALTEGRREFSAHAPRIETMTIPTDKIREVIGSGGKVIREIVEVSGAKVDINDDGVIKIASANADSIKKAYDMIYSIVAEPEEGKVYTGKVVKLVDFGAFVNFFGKRDGLVHVSQIASKRLTHPNEVLKEGQEVKVKLLGFDDRGKVRLGMKMVDQETGQEITESKEETAE